MMMMMMIMTMTMLKIMMMMMTASSVISEAFATREPAEEGNTRIASVISKSLADYHLQSRFDYGSHYAIFNI